MQQVQCYSCKEYNYCVKKSCNYCKKLGHIIKECLICPQNRQANQAVVANQALDDKSTLTPEVVQQMIISAFSPLGIQGKGNLPSSI